MSAEAMSVERDHLMSIIFASDSLHYYDADKELDIIRMWYDMVKTPLDEATSMGQLEKEAKDTTEKWESRMEEYLQRAIKNYKAVPGLWRAECLVVMMYTDDGDHRGARAFFREYNTASTDRKWKPYRVYTTLLLSALGKLANIKPIHVGKPLYRGLRLEVDPPTASRIFWKAFTSTTLNYQTAKRFAGPDGLVLEFKQPVPRYAAQVGELSKYPEEEVILLPFEAFDFQDVGGGEFHFKTSEIQELLT